MARRLNPAAGPTETTEHDEHAPMVGGAPGVIPEAVQTIPSPGTVSATAARALDPDKPPPYEAKRYLVVGPVAPPGYSVMYANCRVTLREGRVIDETTYDIDLLKKQGVRLQEVTT